MLASDAPETAAPAIETPHATPARDRHGNVMQAPPGTIPMRRVTLSDMARFTDVRDFTRNGPGPAGRAPTSPSAIETTPVSGPSADTSLNHRCAYTHRRPSAAASGRSSTRG